jgi:signal transduction histidine kinase
MTTRSLRTRFLITAAAVIALALVIAASGLSLLFERHVKNWIDGELDAHLTQLVSGMDLAADGRLGVLTKPGDPRFDKPLSGLYWQVMVDDAKEPIRSRSLWDFVVALPVEAGIDEHSHHHYVAGPGGQRLYLIQRHLQLPTRLGAKSARFAVAINDAEVSSAVWRFTSALLPFLALLGALLIAAAWLQVSVGLHPLASIRSKIAAIRSGHEKRLGAGFPEEVQPLAREIDVLLDARDRQVEKARAAAADLAHGLKTPLQVMIGGCSRLKAKGETALADDLEHAALMMQRHVDRQLARARMQSSRGTASADVGAVMQQVVRVLERSPSGEQLEWIVDVRDATVARIHPDDLAEALGGLAENAARFARTRVALTAVVAGVITIRVTDDGPGIPEEKVQEAVKRGARLDASGPGSGLGLAIVADIAEAWGGEVTFARSDDGFTVELKLLPVASAD